MGTIDTSGIILGDDEKGGGTITLPDEDEVTTVIQVDDILIAKDGGWYTLRDQMVAKDGEWHTFGAGCGIAKDGKWYVLNEGLIAPPLNLITVSPPGYTFAWNETTVKEFKISPFSLTDIYTVEWKNPVVKGMTLTKTGNSTFTVQCSTNNSTLGRSNVAVVTWGSMSVEVVVSQSRKP
jgi:hypothetical protein